MMPHCCERNDVFVQVPSFRLNVLLIVPARSYQLLLGQLEQQPYESAGKIVESA
jgi:hypothetical protein